MTRSVLVLSALLLGWSLILHAMSANVAGDPYDPSLEGTQAYGHNGPRALEQGRSVTAIELAIFLLVLLPPWTRRLWPRSMGLSLLFAPWALLSLFSCMHAGGVWMLHGLWILGLAALLGACTAASGIAHALDLGTQREARPPP